MFSRWGAFVYRFRRPVALITIAIAIGLSVFAAQASSHLSSGGWLDPSSESAQVADRLAKDFGAGRSSLIVLFSSTASSRRDLARLPGGDRRRPSRSVKADPHVTGIVGYAETGDRRFISTKGDRAYVVVQLDATDEGSVALVDPIRAEIAPPAGYTVQLTGYGPITKDSAALSEKDLQRAETVSLPVVAIVLILVFASLVAAGMPLLVAAPGDPVDARARSSS